MIIVQLLKISLLGPNLTRLNASEDVATHYNGGEADEEVTKAEQLSTLQRRIQVELMEKIAQTRLCCATKSVAEP